MEKIKFLIFITMILCLAKWTLGEQCDALSTISTQYLGMRMRTEHTVLSMNTPASSECARQCKLFGFCRSFNYGESGEQCELNEEDSLESPGDIEENADFDYFDIDEWPEEIAEGCAGHSCLTDELCVPGPNQTAVCVKANDFIDQKKNECDPNPCQNGGVCEDRVNQYTCNCASGWRGKNCERDVNECRSNPCQNGSTCINEQNDFSCDCPDGWSGKQCDVHA
ncbi:fibropellin-3-like [Mercenaria mercenaria]|uniref:fibropellin-3-like n=1 Tax=Mercenaria mercenaria TaxID=6596 RepID=UPI00234E4444|nr:fibropellin-3-like [Mercenaria mercenaria]